MKINWLTYTIDNWNIKAGHIQLNSYREDGSIANTYPITYSTNPEIEEVKEEIIETKRVEDFADVDADGNDFVNKRVVTDTETKQVPTGKMVKNPQYRNPQSIKDLEKICIENWFTK